MKERPVTSLSSWRPWVLPLLAVLVVLATEQVIERLAQGRALERERLAVLTDLTTLRFRLAGVVDAHLLLVHGLTAVISAHPEIDQQEFARIAQGLVDARHDLRNIVGAPGMVVSLVFPFQGNESVIGLDYRTHPIQAPAALRAMRTGRSVLAGPLPLLQGGMGFVIREPVFTLPAVAGASARFWGLVSSVIEIERLYREAGLLEILPRLRLVLQGMDGTGAAGPMFFGDPRILVLDPVTIDIEIPGGTWRLAAIPHPDWSAVTWGTWLIRLAGLLIALTAGATIHLLARSNQELTESRGRLRALLDTIPDLVWLKDPNGVYLACNPRVEQLHGARESEILGRCDHDFVPAGQAERLRANDQAAMAADGPWVNEEWVTFASDGRRTLLETIKTPLCDSRGRVVGLLGIARDITERKRVEDAVHRLNTELEERVAARTAELAAINKELETFTYSVSHDLKAPLRGIDGYSRLLLEDHLDQLDAEGQLFLRNVRRGVDQMGQLIDDLLAYSRMERRSLLGVPVDLADLVTRLLAERAADIQASGTRVEVELTGLSARADPDGLAMVLRNLIDNALKFHRPGEPPLIRLGGRSTGSTVQVDLQDEGIGFDMRFHDRIFEIFQRLQRAEDYPGTGIGLAIVRKAVTRMGGYIWAESAPGAGATFHLELPR